MLNDLQKNYYELLVIKSPYSDEIATLQATFSVKGDRSIVIVCSYAEGWCLINFNSEGILIKGNEYFNNLPKWVRNKVNQAANALLAI